MGFYPNLQKQGYLFEIWHPYWFWECYQNNMWAMQKNRHDVIINCATLLSNSNMCRQAMIKAISEFKLSAEHHLTKQQNKKPWLGQAACNIELNATEEETRIAWCQHMTESSQNKANKIADFLINNWRIDNA